MNFSDLYTVPAHVRDQTLDDQSVILDLSTGNYFGLNEVGTIVWSQIQSDVGVKEVVLQIAEKFDASIGEIERDVKQLLKDLEDRKLILPK